jgi:hypothetical protein
MREGGREFGGFPGELRGLLLRQKEGSGGEKEGNFSLRDARRENFAARREEKEGSGEKKEGSFPFREARREKTGVGFRAAEGSGAAAGGRGISGNAQVKLEVEGPDKKLFELIAFFGPYQLIANSGIRRRASRLVNRIWVEIFCGVRGNDRSVDSRIVL